MSVLFGCERSRRQRVTLRRVSHALRLQDRSPGGDQQTGVVGAELPMPLTVRVVDATGTPIARQIVNFRIVSGGGTTFAGASVSDALGRVAQRCTLGTIAGEPQRLEARAVNPASGASIVRATFTATAKAAGIATLKKLSSDTQVVNAGTAVPIRQPSA